MSEYEFALALRIRHPSIEPAQITEALGIGPQHAWKAGDARRGLTRANRDRPMTRQRKCCRLAAQPHGP